MVFFIPHPFPSPVYRLNTWKDWNEGMEEGINGEKKRKDMVSEWDDNDRQEGQTSSQRHLTATRRKRWLGVKDGERWVTSFVSFPPVLTHHHLRIIDKGWCGKEWRCGWVCWSLFPSYHLFSLSVPFPFSHLCTSPSIQEIMKEKRGWDERRGDREWREWRRAKWESVRWCVSSCPHLSPLLSFSFSSIISFWFICRRSEERDSIRKQVNGIEANS